MHFLRTSILAALLTLTPFTLSSQPPQTPQSPHPATRTTDPLPADLRALLAAADRVALHAALHESHPSFTDGTHENDFAAVQAVHRESPAMATRILELARRQNSNSTTTRAPASASSPASAFTTQGSLALYLSTFTASDGHLTTSTYTSVVGVNGAAGAAAANGAGAAASGSGGKGGGQLQSGAELGVGRPWEGAKLGVQAFGLIVLVGVVGLA